MRQKRPGGEVLALLGLARRAGEAVPGTGAVRQGLRDGRVRLVLFAGDGSPTQREKLLPLIQKRRIPHGVLEADRRALGEAVGSSPASAVGVTSPSFAEELLRQLTPRKEGEAGDSFDQRR